MGQQSNTQKNMDTFRNLFSHNENDFQKTADSLEVLFKIF